MKIRIRQAVTADVPILRELIDASVRGLQTRDYTPSQIESALATVYGVDTQLIADGTYLVAEAEGGASAAPLMATVAMSAVVNAAFLVVSRESIITPWFKVKRSVLLQLADQLLGNDGDLPCAVRHQEDDEEQKYAEHGAGEAF